MVKKGKRQCELTPGRRSLGATNISCGKYVGRVKMQVIQCCVVFSLMENKATFWAVPKEKPESQEMKNT